MQQRYLFSEQSEKEIDEILARIVEENSPTALKWFRDLHDKCVKLAAFPQIGRERSDLRPHLFSFPHGNYLIFYRVIPTGIEIARVLDGRRDIPALFRELPAGGVEAPEFAELGTADPTSDR